LAVVDRPGAGRSAYVCPLRECLEQALKRKAFPRTLRCAAEIDDGFISAFERALAAREAVK